MNQAWITTSYQAPDADVTEYFLGKCQIPSRLPMLMLSDYPVMLSDYPFPPQ